MKDLEEIKEYWSKKYPAVLVTLWTNEDGNKYFGIMNGYSSSSDLAANTLGELISQGEEFLRRMR